MERWECHVRAKLFDRDHLQKDPFTGVFQKLTDLAERLEMREKFCCGVEGPVEGVQRLQLHLEESEHRRNKLSEKARDLTSLIYTKEAELQYCHSQVSRFRKEAVSLASGANSLRASLSDCEFALESQSKEMAALRLEQVKLRAGLVKATRENEELLERWMEEKKEEAKRVNKHNDAQQRWHRFTKRLNNHLYRERSRLALANSRNTTDQPSSAMQKHCWPGRPNTWSTATVPSPTTMQGPHGATDTQPANETSN